MCPNAAKWYNACWYNSLVACYESQVHPSRCNWIVFDVNFAVLSTNNIHHRSNLIICKPDH